ncbi:MAG: sulfite exporter TauE/SafE family protein [Candidatus Micrarchaeota archaeon]|nr:sulfite exporter TauE/SafE family protein [Candidatus Micrarchaeota archaeon]
MNSTVFGLSFVLAVVLLAYSVFYAGNDVYWVFAVAAIGFFLGFLDTSMGMGYGTVGTPVLLLLGFSPKVVVPSILISQFVAASIGAVKHHRFRNMDLTDTKGNDFKLAVLFLAAGIAGAVVGVYAGVKLPKLYVTTYIGLLVMVMGILAIVKFRFRFSFLKAGILSLISSFNKTISGGGYGPVLTMGQIISGNGIRNSVGITIFTVAVINLVGFFLYNYIGGALALMVPLSLSVGAMLGAQIGPGFTRNMKTGRNLTLFGIITLLLGAFTIAAFFMK